MGSGNGRALVDMLSKTAAHVPEVKYVNLLNLGLKSTYPHPRTVLQMEVGINLTRRMMSVTQTEIFFSGRVENVNSCINLQEDPQRRETARVRHLREALHGLQQPLLPPNDAQQGKAEILVFQLICIYRT